MALAAVHGAEHELDGAVLERPELRPLAGNAARDLDVVGDGNSPAPPASFRFRAARLEARPVRRVERRIHCGRVVAAVVGNADGVRIRHRSGGDQVASAKRDPVEAVLVRGEVDQPLDHIDDLGPAGAAIHRRGRGIGQHRASAEVDRGDAVDPLGHREPLAKRQVVDREGSEVDRVDAPQGEETAFRVEGQRGLRDEVAGMAVGEEALAPVGGPLDGPSRSPCGPGHQRELRRKGVPGAEIAAHVAEHRPAALDRNSKGGREASPRLYRAAPGARAQGVAARGKVVFPDDHPRLQWRTGHAVDPALEGHHVGRTREGRIGRRPVAHLAGEGQVVRAAGPEARRAVGQGGPRVRHRRQGLVVHLDPLARIGGGPRGLGHDQRDRLAAVAHGIDGQRRVRGHGHLEAVRQAELGVGGAGPVRVVGDRPHPVAGRVRPRQHRQHARARRGPGGIDRMDPMGVGASAPRRRGPLREARHRR